jgi:hypothetical protein
MAREVFVIILESFFASISITHILIEAMMFIIIFYLLCMYVSIHQARFGEILFDRLQLSYGYVEDCIWMQVYNIYIYLLFSIMGFTRARWTSDKYFNLFKNASSIKLLTQFFD